MNIKTTHFIFILLLIFGMGTTFFTSSSWLQTNLWSTPTSSISGLSSDFGNFSSAFESRMNTFLKTAEPGYFDPDKCTPKVSITDLVTISQKAWGRDEKSLQTISKFQSIQSENSDQTFAQKLEFIQSFLEGSDLISFAVFKTFSQDYFLEYAERLIFEEKEKQAEEDTEIILPISQILQESQTLSSQILQEIALAKSALDAAFTFLKEQHRAATLVTGTCDLLDKSDSLRSTFKAERGFFMPILKALLPDVYETSA